MRLTRRFRHFVSICGASALVPRAGDTADTEGAFKSFNTKLRSQSSGAPDGKPTLLRLKLFGTVDGNHGARS